MKFEDIVLQQFYERPISTFKSFEKLKKWKDFEAELRQNLKKPQKEMFDKAEDLRQEYLAERDYEIVKFTIELFRSILKG